MHVCGSVTPNRAGATLVTGRTPLDATAGYSLAVSIVTLSRGRQPAYVVVTVAAYI